MKKSSELFFAIETAKKAGKILMKHYGKTGYNLKADSSLVTEADIESEKFIISQISRKFPKHAVFAEESGSSGDSEFIWFIDPLDGTANFAHSFPSFAVSIALAQKGKVILGAVYDPYKGDLFFAEHRKGAFLENRLGTGRIRVSKINELKNAYTGYDFGGRDLQKKDMLTAINALATECRGSVTLNGAALMIPYVACGRLDAYFCGLGAKGYDIAAAGLILDEAGGKFTGFDSSPWTLKTSRGLASNGMLHEKILSLVKGKL